MNGIQSAAYVICALAATLLVYRYDLYDREPWYLVLGAAAAGALAMHLLGGLEDAAIGRLAGANTWPYAPALVAASFEEGARLLVVAAIALAVPRIFNDPMDGLVYGSMVGIGMALEESWAVVSQSPDGAALSLAEIVRLSGHLIMGGITGFGVGLITRPGARPAQWLPILAACVAASVLLHFLWDVAALEQIMSGGLAWWPSLAASAVMLTGMVAYGGLVVLGASLSRDALAPVSDRSLWGWPFRPGRPREHRSPAAPAGSVGHETHREGPGSRPR